MYSVVLAVALTSGTHAPDFFLKKHHLFHGGGAPTTSGCTGCYGCGGCTGCYGCGGGVCYGGGGCVGLPSEGAFACMGGHNLLLAGGFGYYGTCDGGCYGVGHSWTNQVPILPALPAVASETPKTETPPEKTSPDKDPKNPDNPKPGMEKDNKSNPDMDKGKTNALPGKPTPVQRARMVIELPPDARLFVDDHLTRSTSEVRSFVTPDLAPGQNYYYTVRAEIEVDGKRLIQSRRVVLRSGEEVHQRFDDPRAVNTKSDLQQVGRWVIADR